MGQMDLELKQGGLALAGVTLSYDGVAALADVSITIRPGSIHALVGENGAGKSTATKILAGLAQPDSGRVLIGLEPVVIAGRGAAIRHGIGLVPQQLALIGEMSLSENLLLMQPARLVHRGRARDRLMAAAQQAGISILPDVPVRTLGFAERQLGELAIALAQGATTLLLDEPTSAIGPYETGRLFERLQALAASGTGILIVTHRLDEVRSSADAVTVLSHGRVTLQAAVADTSDDQLIRAMVGDVPVKATRSMDTRRGPERLRLRAVNASGSRSNALHDVSLIVNGGEILGVLGVVGNGQRRLAAVAAGEQAPESGSVLVDGQDLHGDAAFARRCGVGFVPEERGQALLPDATLTRSCLLGPRMYEPGFTRGGMIRWKAVADYTMALLRAHDVRPCDPQRHAGELSGGNQQKLLLGRELDGTPAVAILHGPTQGLDLQAAAAIRRRIRILADQGTAVLLISTELDEVLELADNIMVLSQGQIVDAFPTGLYERDRVGRAMAGLGSGRHEEQQP